MRASTIRILALLFAMLVLAAGPALRAQPDLGAREMMDRGTAELVVEGPVPPGGTVNLAIRFEPQPGWHGYWSNPGDAGQGIQLRWQLPPGWQAGEAQFPVPTTLLTAGLMNHVYKGEHAVIVPISIPPDAVPGRSYEVAVKGEWLTCSDTLCVPQWATLRAQVTVAAQDGARDPRFALWRAAIPPMLDSRGSFALRAGQLELAIPIPAAMALDQPHLFIANERLIDYAARQDFRRKGDLLIARLPLKGDARVDRIEGILALGGGNGVRFLAKPGPVPAGGTPVGPAGGTLAPLWLLLLGAFAGGLILNVMPCVFPILSIKALALARAGESQAQARREGLAYTAGVVLATLALGALLLALRAAGEQIGWAFQLQEPGVVVALLVLAAAITANFAGLFELPQLSFTRSGEPASAFATGLLAAFVATPCTGPFMAAALGAALLLPVVPALLLFAALGLGLALPFLAIGLVPALRSRLPRPGPWMVRFRQAMAVPMGLTALALVWLTARLGGQGYALVALVLVLGMVIALAVVGRLQRAGRMAWPAFGLILCPFLIFAGFALPASYAEPDTQESASLLRPEPFSPAALAAARASGRPVFLWFTADWCVTCKINESVAIEREATRAAFAQAGVVAMVGDWTRRDATITQFLAEQRAAGVPLYLWYEPGAEAEQLPQVLTSDMLSERAQRRR